METYEKADDIVKKWSKENAVAYATALLNKAIREGESNEKIEYWKEVRMFVERKLKERG